MSRRSNRLALLDSEHRLQILQQLLYELHQCRLRLLDLKHGAGNTDHRFQATSLSSYVRFDEYRR